MPPISRTEQIALESGTVGVERLAFAGTLRTSSLAKYAPAAPTPTDERMLARAPALVATTREADVLRHA